MPAHLRTHCVWPACVSPHLPSPHPTPPGLLGPVGLGLPLGPVPRQLGDWARHTGQRLSRCLPRSSPLALCGYVRHPPNICTWRPQTAFSGAHPRQGSRSTAEGSLASSEIPVTVRNQQLCALIMLGLALYTSPLSPSHLRDPVSHGLGPITVPFYRTEN